MVVVAVFQNPDQAHLLCSYLASREIRTEIFGEYAAGAAPQLYAVGGGVRVMVEPETFAAAMEAVRELELLDASPWAGMPCPSCGSAKVQWSRNYAKDISWIYFLGALFLLGIPLLLRRKSLHCLDCGAFWRPQAAGNHEK